MKTKVLLVMISLVGIAQLALADVALDVLHCSSEVAKPDQGFEVDINVVMSMPIPKNNKPLYTAKLSEGTVAGLLELQSYAVDFKVSEVPGAGSIYKSKDFKLKLPLGAPRADGKRLAYLTASSKGRNITDVMLCSKVK